MPTLKPRAASPRTRPFVDGPAGLQRLSPTHASAFLGLMRAGEELERRLDRELRAEHALSLRGYEVLLHLGLFSPDGELPLTQLTRQAPLSQSQVSRLVGELERRGLVRRTSDEQDSRAIRVRVTDSGLDVLRKAQATHHRGLEEALYSRLDESEVAALAEITAKLLDDRS